MHFIQDQDTENFTSIIEQLIIDDDLFFLKYEIISENLINPANITSEKSLIFNEINDFITENIELFKKNIESKLDLLLKGYIDNQFIFFIIKDSFIRTSFSFSNNTLEDSDYIHIYCEKSNSTEYSKYTNFTNALNRIESPVFLRSINNNQIFFINILGLKFIEKYPEFTKSDIFKNKGIPKEKNNIIFKLNNKEGNSDHFILEHQEINRIDSVSLRVDIIKDYSSKINIQKRQLKTFNALSRYSELFDIIPWHFDFKTREIVFEFDKSNKITNLYIRPFSKRIKFDDLLYFIYPDDIKTINKIVSEGKKKKFLKFESNIRLYLYGQSEISSFKLCGLIDLRNKDDKNVNGYIQDNLNSFEQKNKLRKLNIEAESLHIFQTAFLEIIYNELRSPINKLVGFTELITSDKKKTDENRELYYKKIKYYKDKLLSLLESSLDYSYNEPQMDINNNNLTLKCFIDKINEAIQTRDKSIFVESSYEKEIILAPYKIEKLAVAISCLVFCHIKRNNGVKPIIHARLKDNQLCIIVCSKKNISKISDNISYLTSSQYTKKADLPKNVELDLNIALSYSFMVDAKLKFLHNYFNEDIFIIETKFEYVALKNDFALKLTDSWHYKKINSIVVIGRNELFTDLIQNVLLNRYELIDYTNIESFLVNYIGDNPIVIFVDTIDDDFVDKFSIIIDKYTDNKKIIISINDKIYCDKFQKLDSEKFNFKLYNMPYNIENLFEYLYTEKNT